MRPSAVYQAISALLQAAARDVDAYHRERLADWKRRNPPLAGARARWILGKAAQL